MQYELTNIAVCCKDWRISGLAIPCLLVNCPAAAVSKRVVWIKSRASGFVFKKRATGGMLGSNFSNRSEM